MEDSNSVELFFNYDSLEINQEYGCSNYLNPKSNIKYSFGYNPAPKKWPMLPNFFDPNYNESPCNNIETCSLTIADEDKMTGQKTCGVETLTTHVFLKKDA